MNQHAGKSYSLTYERISLPRKARGTTGGKTALHLKAARAQLKKVPCWDQPSGVAGFPVRYPMLRIHSDNSECILAAKLVEQMARDSGGCKADLTDERRRAA